MQGTSSGIYFAPETTEFIDCILTLVNSESFNNFNAAKRLFPSTTIYLSVPSFTTNNGSASEYPVSPIESINSVTFPYLTI